MRPMLYLVAILGLLSCVGCSTIGAGPKTTHALRRRLNAWETVAAVPIEKAHKAAIAGLADLSLKPVNNRVDKITGLLDGFLADGTSFEVQLEALGETVTRMRVRCGMIGDRDRSNQLFRAIERHL